MARTVYTVAARSNYSDVEFTSRAKAVRYARSITDGTNDSTKVYANGGTVAWYRYAPNNGGRVYKAGL